MNTEVNDMKKTSCPEASSALILYLYGEADDPKAFESHLEGCAECRRILEEHRSVINSYRSEAVEAPGTLKALPAQSLRDKFLDLFQMPALRPVMAGLAALLVVTALIFWNLRAVEGPEVVKGPSLVTGEAPSYVEMASQMDDIEEDIDNLFAMNGHSQSFSEYEDTENDETIQYDFENYSETTNLITELDEIQESIHKF